MSKLYINNSGYTEVTKIGVKMVVLGLKMPFPQYIKR